MGLTPDFNFEPAPDLPGSDRASRYGFAAIRKMLDRLWDVEVEGLENIPAEGPAVITPNHLSFCDSLFVPGALPRRVWAVGKAEYMDSWKTRYIFPAMGMIPVDRTGGDAAKAALDTAARVLDKGLLFMIYPEGTRSRSGNLHKGRTGAARLAARCNAPIIPTGHIGTPEIQPPDSVMMKTGLPCTVRFGEPMRVEDFGDPADPRVARVFTDAVMYEISKLSGQAYVDTYAGKTEVASAPSSPSTPTVAGPTGPSRPTAPSVSVPAGRPTRPSVPPGRLAAAERIDLKATNGSTTSASAQIS